MFPLMVMFTAFPLFTNEYHTSVAGDAIGVLIVGWQLMSVVYGCSVCELTLVRLLKVDTAPIPLGQGAGAPKVPSGVAPKQSSLASCANECVLKAKQAVKMQKRK
jgi:hypothetical protein